MEIRSTLLRAGQPVLLALFLLFSTPVLSQEAAKPPGCCTKIQGYFAIFHPIDGYNTPANFKDRYVVGFPIGINVFKKEKVGYSFELFPFIQSDSTGSKVNKIVFHPGVVFPLTHGFGFAARVAFETTGRYGFTQVFSKSIIKTKSGAFGAAAVIAERFGNEMGTSVSFGIGFGLSF